MYDKDRNSLGETIARGDPHPEGTYHLVVGIWVVNSLKQVLLTLRHPEKEQFPNLWENTGGSVLAGETSLQGAVRELKEETGIFIRGKELIRLGSLTEKTAIVDIYMLKKDFAIKDLKMQPEEVVDARWVTLRRLEQMIDTDMVSQASVRRWKAVKNTFLKEAGF